MYIHFDVKKFVLGMQINCFLLLFILFVCFRMAAGTAHGFALFDYAQKKPIATRCTLNPGGMYA